MSIPCIGVRRRQLPGLLVILGSLFGQALTDPSGATWALESWRPHEHWLIQQGRVAPWAPAGTTTLRNRGLAGQVIHIETERIQAPEPLACEQAQHEFILSSAEGLFQGALPAPAERTARSLGLSHLPVLTWRVTCTNGTFDYHLIGPTQMLIGLDEVVWSIQRTKPESSPESAVLELLRDHMTHDMAFTQTTIDRKQHTLTKRLTRAIVNYFAHPSPKDEPPVINGDPFTDSQEYPTGFVFGSLSRAGSRTTVPVRFHDGGRSKVVEFRLQLVDKTWRVDDLHYTDGTTFRMLLKPGKG